MSSRLVIPSTRNTDNSRAGYVYLISEPHGYYKIGHAVNVELRLSQLQSSTPFELTLLGRFKCEDRLDAERYIHGLLAQYHVRNEWFRLPDKRAWSIAVDDYKKHLIERSRPKLITPPAYDQYNEEIRAQLAKLPA